MKMDIDATLVYLIEDKVGGILSMNSNLIRYHQPDGFAQRVILLHNRESADTRFDRLVEAESQSTLEYSYLENIHAVIRRLRRLIPDQPGVLISNNSLELAMLCRHEVRQTVVQIVHDAYNLRLALAYEPVVDVFVAHSRFFYEQLQTFLPTRVREVFYLPYGIPLAPVVRQPAAGPLRLIFIGRLHDGKGVLDLPVIDELLREARLEVQWTIVGDGPRKQALRTQWGDRPNVQFFAPETNGQVLALCAQNDVFVLPTRFEGFPVSLLEAMSAGLVPVVSDLPSGIPEVVDTSTGFRPAMGDCAAFAVAIQQLYNDRVRLEQMSRACRQTVEDRFDIRRRVLDYQALFAQYAALRRPRPRTVPLPSRSRLDQPWLPNWSVIAARSLRRRTQ